MTTRIVHRFAVISLITAITAITAITVGAKDNANFERHEFKSAAVTLPYRLLPPKVVEPGKAYPLVVFLHGAGERGTDNVKPLVHVVQRFAEAELREKYPCYVIAPQCPAGNMWVDTPWTLPKHAMPAISNEMTALIALIADMETRFKIDEKRIYAMGLSMGGFGAWDLAMRQPGVIAAAVPICGGADDTKAAVLKDMPIWAFHGDKDGVVKTTRSRNIVAAIKAAGGSPKYTEYPGVGHGSWGPASKEPGLFEWLFKQKK